MKTALSKEPGILGDRFSQVWMWNEWPDCDGPDTGIDLVAEEEDGGLCAIQCKFFDPHRPVPKNAIDSFMSASEPDRFTSRLIINTGGYIQKNALKTLEASPKPCRVLDKAELDGWDVDWLKYVDDPEGLQFQAREPYTPHPYQKEAVEQVLAGFQKHDRGQLVLPCGTGKTAVTLWIAEQQVGLGGRVLYLVPSIALMAQTMREWSEQKSLPLRYVGICSDTRAGRTDEDASLLELDYPVTTDLEKIRESLQAERPEALMVVFCTYQSLPLVATAQADGAPAFDLVVCDEAHRTTGVEETGNKSKDDQKVSPFRLVHDAARIHAHKRLYATATPRLYTESAKGRAADRNLEIFSMNDESVYGPEFYKMAFSQAIEGGWLTDYKVIILTLKSDQVSDVLNNLLAAEQDSGLNLDDAVKLLGCWDALADPEGVLSDRNVTGDQHNPLLRAITFTNTIKASKMVEAHWQKVVDVAREQTGTELQTTLLPLNVQHVDGTQNSLDRQRKLAWLKTGEADNGQVCRVLSNARCLTEGVDVPALDAVLFLAPRKSQVDVVQAVGRVMRRAADKQMGYIILPVVISPDEDPDKALDDNKTFQVVWSVLRALRSHDDRFDLEINSLDLNKTPTERIKIINGGDGEDNGQSRDRIPQLPLDLVYKIPPGAIYARIVEKCGDRKYWPQWAADVAQIADRIRLRVTGLIQSPERITLREDFHSFLADLQQTLNPSLQEEDLVAMVAQHLVTGPVFQALFADYDFVGSNPVSRALDRLVALLETEGLENETRGLEGFYESVRKRAQALDNSEARQKVLLELYERFFQVALKKEAERLGIVYTPVEVVDFILHSADHALQKHFGRRLTSQEVHILDPFTGTGTFIVRLLQNPELIRDEDLSRKFKSELHANEIVLLAYYIAAINIEETYHGRRGMQIEYAPFDGIVFTDTFTLGEDEGQFAETFPVNSERVERQKSRDITVIVGNPPYSAGQKSAADDNPNVFYPHLAGRVEESYVARSPAVSKKSLYDSYKLAVRWASDRIKIQGVIAFVTNGSFIDGNADAGLRACLADEFSHIYVFNLRGNQRTQGERSRQEGGKIFGSGSRLPVAIMVLVRDSAPNGNCQIRYKDIGDYLSQKEKLQIIKESGSIVGILDWQRITPDEHHDWLNQRDPAYQQFMPLAIKGQKSRFDVSAVLSLSCPGVNTARDPWIYNFDRMQLHRSIQTMTTSYEQRRQSVLTNKRSVEEAGRNDAPTRIKWTRELRKRLRRKEILEIKQGSFRQGMYRPFCKQHIYFDPQYNEVVYRIPSMFPTPEAFNLVFGVTGRGETVGFSALITDAVPNFHSIAGAQWFARWRYEIHDPDSPDAWVHSGEECLEEVPGYQRVDNITEECLQQFRKQYPDLHINQDDIWNYIYGLLHAPDYREKYRADLSKDLPRIPFAPDFGVFRDAGEQLVALHLGYETCPEYRLIVQIDHGDNPYQIATRPMQWGGTRKEPDRSVLHVTPFVTLRNIPDAAHRYVINGRTPLEWAIDRLHIRKDKESGIVNDPNAWFAENPAELVAHLERLVHVSVETTRIVEGLPPALAD
ncbi:MAG: DEAD/DEAH box helicase family protein [Caldilineaceae bacterium]|nr:DEAD/DEAH box helicase family protein [Caldilineaceae bacterium]MDE0463096.1 DEAD/DEAH box helicase family protein [Caldilineaceae bacterium]